jgi:hypothetical protein
MHVVIAVSSLSPEPAKTQAQQRAVAALAGRDFVEVFQGVYVLALKQEAERAEINQVLDGAVSAGDPQAVFLVSPSMPPSSGPYLGRLAPTIWPEVNKKIAVP